MNIYLIGYRCTGKTTIGKMLALMLGFRFIDTDNEIQTQAGVNISDFVQQNGWALFRKLETRVLYDTGKKDRCVISTGGGIVTSVENREFLSAKGYCIWLKAGIDCIIDRLQNDEKTKKQRPALSPDSLEQETVSLLEERTPLYETLGQIEVDTEYLTPEACIDFIHRRLKHVRL